MLKYVIIALVLIINGCESQKRNSLPIYGNKKTIERIVDGHTVHDTINHTIADFSFYNQDSVLINNDSLKGKIYVADFFFTSCPTICPAMKKQLLRVYNKFKQNDKFRIVSYTIDPSYDNVQVLSTFAGALGVKSNNWHFLTGNQGLIYELGETSYMVTAGDDSEAPGGYIHSGAFILVDSQRQVRGVYDGTIPEQVDLLLEDIDLLLLESTNAQK